jgi:kynureninase
VAGDGEFHTLRRQLARLAEEGVELVRVAARPADTLAERLAERIDDRTAAVLVSAVLFEDARIVPGLGELAQASARLGVELLVDAYHALGVLPFPLAALGLGSAFVVGGGYKYLQLGEGNCFLRLPRHAGALRPVVTGWFAEFDALAEAADPELVAYGRGAAAFAGSTYDPTSHYRAARVLDFFAEQGLTPEVLRDSYRRQLELLAQRFDELELPDEMVTRDRETPLDRLGGFLALVARDAAGLQRALGQRGVSCDSRGRYLRLGPAPYLSDAQIEAAIERLGEAVRAS